MNLVRPTPASHKMRQLNPIGISHGHNSPTPTDC